MATKRSAPSVHPSRSGQVPTEPSRKRRKPNIKAGSGAKSFKKSHPVNELKSRIRSLRRQLERNDSLSAVAQQEKERALRAAEDELERNQQAARRNDMIGKWHKVRFFDRRKAEKRLRRAKKELNAFEGSGEGRVALKQRVGDAEVDVKYAIYYPLEKEYVPLFPRKRKEQEEEDVEADGVAEVERQGDPVMWQTVKQCMADGTLEALRNGRLAQTAEGDESEDEEHPQSTKKKRKLSKTGKSQAEADSDGESDEDGNAFWE